MILSLLLALTVCIGCVIAFASDGGATLDVSEISMSTEGIVSVSASGKVSLTVGFLVDEEDVVKLSTAAENTRYFVSVSEYDVKNPPKPDGNVMELTKTGPITVGEKSVYRFSAKIDGISANDASTPLAVRGFIAFSANGEEHIIESDFKKENNVFVPYECVYEAYVGGTVASDADAQLIKTFLASRLSVSITDGEAKCELDCDGYKTPYSMEYFDGVLRVYLEGGKISEWMLTELLINGEARYFEIYDGEIRLVV